MGVLDLGVQLYHHSHLDNGILCGRSAALEMARAKG
jgi:hypothetical protein